MSGFRKLPNDVWAELKPRPGAHWSRVEMYIDHDQDVFQNRVVSVRAYAQRWGCSWRTARAALTSHSEHNFEHNDSPLKTEESTDQSTICAALTSQPVQHSEHNPILESIETETETRWLDSPHTLPSDFVETMAALTLKSGIRYSADEFVAWYIQTAPDLVAYRNKAGKPYKNHRLATRNWWRRARPEEIAAALNALENRRFQARFGSQEIQPTEPTEDFTFDGYGDSA